VDGAAFELDAEHGVARDREPEIGEYGLPHRLGGGRADSAVQRRALLDACLDEGPGRSDFRRRPFLNSRRSQHENKLGFPILSDPHNDVAASFGLPDYRVALYEDTFKNNLELVNGDDSWTLPMPARFIIGQDGVIRYAEVNPDYSAARILPSCFPSSTSSRAAERPEPSADPDRRRQAMGAKKT
jgi:AhpC/TSA family